MSDKNKTYEYKGDGLGVPGLPHVVTREEAEALGVVDLLDAAIVNGSYREAGNSQKPGAATTAKRAAEEKE